MVSLLDVNVLVALAWPNHVHHAVAHRWLHAHQHLGWATCPVTQSSFVRVSSNHRILAGARSPREAMRLLKKITDLSDHVFWPDDVALVSSELVAPEKLVGHRQITDAHLLALALSKKGRLATLDRGVRQLVPDAFDPEEAVAVLTIG